MKINKGHIENSMYIKYVEFSKAVLWRDRQISISKEIAENWLWKVDSIKFIDRKKGEAWVATVEDVKKSWIYKQVGQEPQYYIPIEIFKKEPYKE